MMSKIRGFLMVVFAAIAVVSGVIFVSDMLSKKGEEAAYEALRESVTFAETEAVETTAAAEAVEEQPLVLEPETEYVINPELKALMDDYEDVVGWIKIGDTHVDYPVLQDVDDNEYYLHHDMDGKKTASGAIYLDSNHDINADGLHVVYGHHMKNGSMFKDIVKFRDADFMASHQDITIWTGEKEISLEPVYCYAGKADGTYRSVIEAQDDLEQFLKEKTGQDISGDNVFVLVTCSYGSDDERTYLVCKERA